MYKFTLPKEDIPKKEIMPKKIPYYFFLLFFFGCMNRYEKQVIGHYKVKEYEIVDSLTTSSIGLPDLTLNKNRTFSLVFKDSTTIGKWKADDNGDFTWIEFSFHSQNCEGRVVGSESQPEIWIYNPLNFTCSFLKKLIFKRVGGAPK